MIKILKLIKRLKQIISVSIICLLILSIPGKGLTTPPGPVLPWFLEYQYSDSKETAFGKPFVMSISVTPITDIHEIEIRPWSEPWNEEGNTGITITNSPAYKGHLKRGETKKFDFKFFIPDAAKNSKVRTEHGLFVGKYGLNITSKSMYRQMRQYCKQKFNKDKVQLKFLLERIDGLEKENPIYQDVISLPMFVE
jgi:hypothetical protein